MPSGIRYKGNPTCHPDRKHQAHGLCFPCYRKQWVKKDEKKQYYYTLKHKYGITREEYEIRNEVQGGRCAICKQKPVGDLKVDHDHETLKVRGLLCNSCNVGIGCLGDDVDRLKAAIGYLASSVKNA
jgi:hypothetical protein